MTRRCVAPSTVSDGRARLTRDLFFCAEPLLTLDGKSVEEVLLVVVRIEAIISGRFGPRCPRGGSDLMQSGRLRLRLRGEHRWRCHVGRWCRRGRERLYRVGPPGLW